MISKVMLKDHLEIGGEHPLADATEDSLATPDVGTDTPEDRANQETDILLMG